MTVPQFVIDSDKIISKEFTKRNIFTFKDAAEFILQLKYARNKNKNDLASVFIDKCGTCGTKHALLKQLAIENDFKGLKLILGFVKMNAQNTPAVADTLKKNNLEYIPEAHNYLKFEDNIFDYTKPNFTLMHGDDLLEEIEIMPDQISEHKVSRHKQYLENWLKHNPKINLGLSELWLIREQCIRDLES